LKRKFNPFGKSKSEVKIVPIGTPETGLIYLEQKGYLTPKLNPVEAQYLARQQAELIVYTEEAIRRVAKAKNVLDSEARQLLFGIKKDGVDIQPTESFEDWISQDERIRMLELQVSAVNRYKVATLYLKYCYAYDVTIAGNLSASSEPCTIAVQPLKNSLAIGEKVKIDNIKLEVVEFAPEDSESIKVKNVPKNIEDGTVGFILDFETGQPKLGIPSWEEKDTMELLSEPQIGAIFEHYQREIGVNLASSSEAASSEDSAEMEGKQLLSGSTISGDSSTQNLLTGLNSTSESSALESEIQSLNSRTLETVPTT
jgi:hypothetical protein